MKGPALDPIATHPRAGKGNAGISDPIAVDPGHAAAQAPGDPVRPADVARPHGAAQAISGVIGQRQRLCLSIKGDGGKHWTKDLLPCHPHVIVHMLQHGRGHKEAAGKRATQAGATGNDLGPVSPGNVEIAGHLVQLGLRGEGAKLGCGIKAVANLEAGADFGHLVDKVVVDLTLDEQAGAGIADLPGIVETAHGGTTCGGGQIGIGKDDVGGLAPQFHLHPFDVAGRGLDDFLARQG